MKSIKRGRGPSAMGAMGSVFVAIFGVVWTIMATSMGAPIIFTIFGIFFVCMAIVQALYNYKNATSKNRFSEFDITDDSEETDPFEQMSLQKTGEEENSSDNIENENIGKTESQFCPFCGTKVDKGYRFCSKCGKKLP